MLHGRTQILLIVFAGKADYLNKKLVVVDVVGKIDMQWKKPGPWEGFSHDPVYVCLLYVCIGIFPFPFFLLPAIASHVSFGVTEE